MRIFKLLISHDNTNSLVLPHSNDFKITTKNMRLIDRISSLSFELVMENASAELENGLARESIEPDVKMEPNVDKLADPRVRKIREVARRPIRYSENERQVPGQRTNHLTVECLLKVRAQILFWDDSFSGWFPIDDGSSCDISLMQQITCQQTLSPSQSQPIHRNSWSAECSSNTHLTMPNISRTVPHWEYIIQGNRVSDQKTVFSCALVPHTAYISALPTFHHWRIGDKKFALSFGSAYDASKFNNRLQKALSHLTRQSKSSSGESNLDNVDDLDDDVFTLTENLDDSNIQLGISLWPPVICVLPSTSAKFDNPPEQHPVDVEEVAADAFQPLLSDAYNDEETHNGDDLPPMDPERARLFEDPLTLPTPAHNCTKCHKNFFTYNKNSKQPSPIVEKHRHKLSLSAQSSGADSSFSKVNSLSTDEEKSMKLNKIRSIRSSSNPGSIMFVDKNKHHYKKHEAEMLKSKSLLESHLRAMHCEKDTTTFPLRNTSFEIIQREKCLYCGKWYNVKDNRYGVCKESPDFVEKWIKRLTLYSLASSFIEKRLRNSDQNSLDDCCSNPTSHCRCFSSTSSQPRITQRTRRRAWFAVLSLFLPCLCCYKPLMKTYNCRGCGALRQNRRFQSGKHSPAPRHPIRKTVRSNSGYRPHCSFGGNSQPTLKTYGSVMQCSASEKTKNGARGISSRLSF